MRLSGLRGAFLVAVVIVALAAGLASAHGAASAQAPATDTVTTPLQPGWNLIGWMGPGTTAEDLFDKIPALQVVAAWDDEAGRYRWARRGGTAPLALERISRGRGLFLWLGGTRSAPWTRPASVEGMLLTLPSGYSLVGWAGLDGTPIAEAVGRFGDALVGASRWNAATQSYQRYEPGSEEPADGMPALNHGDALWVELSEERRWWQSGTERTRFAFEAPVTQERKSELRDEMERVVAFFAERYGIEPPEFMVLVDPVNTDNYALGRLIRIGVNQVIAQTPGYALAHEYFHVLQFLLRGQHPGANGSPTWLTEGTAEYGSSLYRRGWRAESDSKVRNAWSGDSLRIDEPLQALEAWEPFHEVSGPAYGLGALATDWLVRRAAALSANAPFTPLAPGGLEPREAYAAHIEYYRLLRSSFSWQAAFKEAFGIGVNDFYAAFEEYRTALGASRLPHLADDEDTPVLVFQGQIPADTMARIRAEFADLLEFSRERFGSGGEYTVFVAADPQSGMAAHLNVVGWEVREGTCRSWGFEVLFLFLTCDAETRHELVLYHFRAGPNRLAPLGSLPPAAEGYPLGGPIWLREGTIMYTEAAYRSARGGEPFSDVRRRHTADAARASHPLRQPAYFDPLPLPEHLSRRALSFLAADWLAQHAGERSIFEYYRLLPSSASWQEAFEGAFGITIDDFYAAFAKYRAAGFTS